jgi:hypothetical protein
MWPRGCKRIHAGCLAGTGFIACLKCIYAAGLRLVRPMAEILFLPGFCGVLR